MSFGFRVFQVTLSQPYKPDVAHEFSNVAMHSGGAQGLFRDTLTSLVAVGDADEHRSTYFTVDAVEEGGWCFVISASGGEYGRERRVRSTTTHEDLAPVASDSAVLDDLPLVLMVPPSGRFGLLFAATSGRSHNAAHLIKALNRKLKGKNIVVKLTSDIADAVAWESYLSSNASVTHIELVQTELSAERITFGKKSAVSRARVILTLADNVATKGKILAAVKGAITGGKKLDLAGVVGMRDLSDKDFDDYRIVYVKDGRERALNVSSDYPHFIYPLDGNVEPTPREFYDAVKADAEHICEEMNLATSQTWWPPKTSLAAVSADGALAAP